MSAGVSVGCTGAWNRTLSIVLRSHCFDIQISEQGAPHFHFVLSSESCIASCGCQAISLPKCAGHCVWWTLLLCSLMWDSLYKATQAKMTLSWQRICLYYCNGYSSVGTRFHLITNPHSLGIFKLENRI